MTGGWLGVNWQDGGEFAQFFQAVVATLHPLYPEAKFGFPGLSPGGVIPERPIGADDFLQPAQPAIGEADFICCHVYWGQDGVDLPAAIEQLRQFCARFPGKRIICSEFSNNNGGVSRKDKADEYAQFYQACQQLPPNLGAMFAFALSWRDDNQNEGFLKLNAAKNGWDMTDMAQQLGSHNI